MSVDTNFYPLGSCTMKYNPKRNERLAGAAGHGRPASLSARRHAAGDARNCSSSCRRCWPRSPGLPAVSLQPAAGAQGELTALLVAAAYFRDRRREADQGARARQRPRHQSGQRRAWPASRPSRSRATPTASSIWTTSSAKLDDQTAVFMITNPNTLGLFDRQIARDRRAGARARRAGLPRRREHERHPGHRAAGRFRRRHDALQPAQDVQRPARRRRPRRGADRGRAKCSAPYLPAPVVERDGDGYRLDYDRPQVDRPRAQLLRQRRRAGAGLLLHPHARARRAAKRVARTPCSMPTICSAA